MSARNEPHSQEDLIAGGRSLVLMRKDSVILCRRVSNEHIPVTGANPAFFSSVCADIPPLDTMIDTRSIFDKGKVRVAFSLTIA
jgi:hypothetical protein